MTYTKLPANEYVDGKAGLESVHRKKYVSAFGAIPSTWHVHHVNRLKWDNRLDNLIALPPSFHKWLHRDAIFYAKAVEAGVMTKCLIEHMLVAHVLKEFTLSGSFVSYVLRMLSRLGPEVNKPLGPNELAHIRAAATAAFSTETAVCTKHRAKSERRKEQIHSRNKQLRATEEARDAAEPASPYVPPRR